MSDKEFVDPDALIKDAFSLAAKIYRSGFKPDVMLVIWRGGTPIGIVIHEFLRYLGVDSYHAALKAESYIGIDEREEPRVEHFDSILKRLNVGDQVLLVDDIFDTGGTIRKVCEYLRAKSVDVRVATLYYKPGNNQTGIEPDFYLRKTASWIVFPHELMDLSLEEIKVKDPFVHGLITECREAESEDSSEG